MTDTSDLFLKPNGSYLNVVKIVFTCVGWPGWVHLWTDCRLDCFLQLGPVSVTIWRKTLIQSFRETNRLTSQADIYFIIIIVSISVSLHGQMTMSSAKIQTANNCICMTIIASNFLLN